MTEPPAVYQLKHTTDLNYPRLLAGHPRNAAVDFTALGSYAEEGDPTTPKAFDLYVKTRRRFDAVWVSGVYGPMVSTRLREVLEGVVADCLEFLPLTVNDEPFWALKVTKVVDALDLENSLIDIDTPGYQGSLEEP